jgi:stress-induced morphogen
LLRAPVTPAPVSLNCPPPRAISRQRSEPPAASEIEKRIVAAIPDAKVEIRDLAGDGDHYAATVTAESFRGKSRVQQHQMVNAAFGADMGTVLHSLALQTKAPD